MAQGRFISDEIVGKMSSRTERCKCVSGLRRYKNESWSATFLHLEKSQCDPLKRSLPFTSVSPFFRSIGINRKSNSTDKQSNSQYERLSYFFHLKSYIGSFRNKIFLFPAWRKCNDIYTRFIQKWLQLESFNWTENLRCQRRYVFASGFSSFPWNEPANDNDEWLKSKQITSWKMPVRS